MSSELARYLASPLPARERPAQDALVALLCEEPGATRARIRLVLRLTYPGAVCLLERAERAGWVRRELEAGRAGRRSVWRYYVMGGAV